MRYTHPPSASLCVIAPGMFRPSDVFLFRAPTDLTGVLGRPPTRGPSFVCQATAIVCTMPYHGGSEVPRMPCASVSPVSPRTIGTSSCLSTLPPSFSNTVSRRRIGVSGEARFRSRQPLPYIRWPSVFTVLSGSIPSAAALCATYGTPLPQWVIMMCGLKRCPKGSMSLTRRTMPRMPRLPISRNQLRHRPPSTILPSVFPPPGLVDSLPIS